MNVVEMARLSPYDRFMMVSCVGSLDAGFSVELLPEALLFGQDIGTKRSSAQITVNHTPEDLVGTLVLAVVNFPPRQIGPFLSEVLTLGVPDANGDVMLIRPDRDVPVGGRLY